MSADSWQIQSLGTNHQRAHFDCGEASLNEYLRQYVTQDAKRSLTRAFVLTSTNSKKVLGYYTLSAASIQRERFPAAQAKKLPRYPIPAVLLGRLAVDTALQGQGCGEFLLVDALKRVGQAAATIGIHAVLVDALSDRAAKYYQSFGFIPLTSPVRTLFLPIEVIENLP